MPPTKPVDASLTSEDDAEDLTSRTDQRRERKASEEQLMQLGEALVGLSERHLARLGLPESVLVVVKETQRVPTASARNRALRFVRAALRGEDIDAIVRNLNRTGKPMAKPRR
jgi:ribosomal 50S subunit-associated protein YjgA (DUF615 family)